jgi:hypothetical protein
MLGGVRAGLTERPGFVEKEVREKEKGLNDDDKRGYASSVAHRVLDSTVCQWDSHYPWQTEGTAEQRKARGHMQMRPLSLMAQRR